MKAYRKTLWIFFSMTLLFLTTGCINSGNEKREKTSGKDLAPVAGNLRLSQEEGYKLARFYGEKDSITPLATYILAPADKPLPENLPSGTVVRVPIKSALIFSTVTAEALKELQSLDVVKGVVDKQFFAQPEIKEGLKTGRIIDAGSASLPSTEKIIAMRPDAILLNQYDGMDVTGIDELGIPVIKMVDNLELTPLGRAEWIKFLGALTGKETLSDSLFRGVSERYQKAASSTSTLSQSPVVLTDNLYQGVWYVPGGNSFQARMIQDAGGKYFLKNDKSTGSLSLSFEQVLKEGRNADIWLLKVWGIELDKEGLLSLDERYANFKAVKTGGVYYANTADGLIFNDMVYHPDLLLTDYAAIFRAFSEGKDPGPLRYFKKMRP